MTRVDLHLHSCYSRHPAEWFLKRLGTRESYTDIDFIYTSAKERGMTFVTLTDHNTIDGALELNRRYPDDTFVSAEVTTYFPENGCKIHVLVYGIDRSQFAEIDRLRHNIHDLREFLADKSIVHSVAHATYDINDRLDTDMVEKLLLLFNTFEGINGARSPYYAKKWMKLLQSLTREDMIRLENRHGIRPLGPCPWSKGLTAGSDDHAGLFQALTYTAGPADCTTPAEFLQAIRDGRTRPEGRSHDFKTFAFSIYKIAYDFSRHKAAANANDLFSMINQMLFDHNGTALAQALYPGAGQKNTEKTNQAKEKRELLILEFLASFARDISETGSGNLDEKFNRIYNNIAALIDNYFVMVMESVAAAINTASLAEFIRNLFASLPFFILSTPFVTSLRHLSKDRIIVTGLASRLNNETAPAGRRTLWFTDTIHDLNGVSVSLRQIAWHAFRTDRDLTLVACHAGGDAIRSLPPNVMNLESVFAYTPELYSSYTMHFPSLLKAIDRISACNPDRIIVSTPGPVGVVGIMAARMLGIPCTGIYHTDFKTQLDLTVKDPTLSSMALRYERLFFSMMDDIRVPSRAYVQILKDRNYPEAKLRVFDRGINASLFHAENRITEGFTIIWAGRVSHDKNIAYLLDVFQAVRQEFPEIRLSMAGTGPDYDYFKDMTRTIPGVTMAGKIAHENLPAFYNAGDLFVFPSTMDTFGMVVLEAQACGVPALVTDIGGPQEIVEGGTTGNVLSLSDRTAWAAAIRSYIRKKADDPQTYAAMRSDISRRILSQFSWEKALADMLDEPGQPCHDRESRSYSKSA